MKPLGCPKKRGIDFVSSENSYLKLSLDIRYYSKGSGQDTYPRENKPG